MPVDDIIEEVNAGHRSSQDYHAATRRPTEGQRPSGGSVSDASPRTAVPSVNSPVHDPTHHYELLKRRTNVERETVEFAGTVFGIVSGVVRLL